MSNVTYWFVLSVSIQNVISYDFETEVLKFKMFAAENENVLFALISPPTYLKELCVEEQEINFVHLKVSKNFLTKYLCRVSCIIGVTSLTWCSNDVLKLVKVPKY